MSIFMLVSSPLPSATVSGDMHSCCH